MPRIITSGRRWMIRQVIKGPRSGCSAAAAWFSDPRSPGRRSAAGSGRAAGTAPWAFASPESSLSAEPVWLVAEPGRAGPAGDTAEPWGGAQPAAAGACPAASL